MTRTIRCPIPLAMTPPKVGQRVRDSEGHEGVVLRVNLFKRTFDVSVELNRDGGYAVTPAP